MIVGIVAEYNPFHNGHKYHIDRAKKVTGADTAVIVMSGSFVQRGEPAVCNKWARAEMAMKCGADLVVELPVIYAVRSAQFFAEGAVKILNALCVDYTAFGAEIDNIERLQQVAQVLKSEKQDKSELVNGFMCQGLSYPAAISAAYPEYADVLDTPNNMLAIEYLMAGAKNPVAIIRKGAAHDGGVSGNIASASYIRQNINEAEKYMPYGAYTILSREIKNGYCLPDNSKLSDIILAKLRNETPEALENILDVSEGIENRMLNAAKTAASLEELYDAVKTKRYTHARIRRIIMNYALGMTKEFKSCEPEYVRVLASNKKGFDVLKKSTLPVVTKTAGLESSVFKREVYATDLYSLLFTDNELRRGGKDYTTSPIIM